MVPILQSTDIDRTAAFWGRLGLVAIAMDGYLIIQHPNGLVIHFGLENDLNPNDNRCCAHVSCATLAEAVALDDEWKTLDPPDALIREPETTFYGMVEWPLADLDANLLRIGGPSPASCGPS